MQKYRVEITDRALADAEAIFRWIRRRAPENAINWYDKLMDRIVSLEVIPGRCPRVPEHELLGIDLRHLLFGVYRIIFVIRAEVVYVVRIRHGARRPLKRSDLDRRWTTNGNGHQ